MVSANVVVDGGRVVVVAGAVVVVLGEVVVVVGAGVLEVVDGTVVGGSGGLVVLGWLVGVAHELDVVTCGDVVVGVNTLEVATTTGSGRDGRGLNPSDSSIKRGTDEEAESDGKTIVEVVLVDTPADVFDMPAAITSGVAAGERSVHQFTPTTETRTTRATTERKTVAENIRPTTTLLRHENREDEELDSASCLATCLASSSGLSLFFPRGWGIGIGSFPSRPRLEFKAIHVSSQRPGC